MKLGSLTPLLALTVALSGCAAGMTRNGIGIAYTDMKDTVTVGVSSASSKTGESCATNILGLVSTGDMSVSAAKRAGGISKVSAVDFSQNSILGVYGKTCTIVHGD